MAQFKLGKLPVRIDIRTLRFSTYAKASLPPPPASKNWSKPVKVWGMMGNDNYGDCTCAAAGHMLKVPRVVPLQGPVGDAAPDPDNGHCIPAVGYDARNLYVVTWGQLKPMSWQFYDAYADESYAVLSSDWISPRTGKAPAGFDMAALTQDLRNLDA